MLSTSGYHLFMQSETNSSLKLLKNRHPGLPQVTCWPLGCRCLLATNSMITFGPMSHAHVTYRFDRTQEYTSWCLSNAVNLDVHCCPSNVNWSIDQMKTCLYASYQVWINLYRVTITNLQMSTILNTNFHSQFNYYAIK